MDGDCAPGRDRLAGEVPVGAPSVRGVQQDGVSHWQVSASRNSPLAMSGEAFRQVGHDLVDQIASFLDGIGDQPVTLADLLASSVNPNVGAWILSPLASEIEAQTVRWVAELIAYPTDCGGLLVSGGNTCNMVCFWAARVAAGGAEMRETGRSGDGRPLVAYASAETHTWIQKAADLSGLSTDIVRWIPTRDDLRMDLEQLCAAMDEDIAAGQ